ncbi:hypothetical protein AVEN_259556-1 [Araneus ventricosus]|uniref:Reverse transcriptase domain-containing protein n=1 Tax=Araneus ventricosus TaxID=182803 RepID=A0A4Y2ES00_ARAVE|nr:hypothetical protein AVEN_259556-1 [Araneus ventricosus]
MLIRGRTLKLPKAKAIIAILFCFTLRELLSTKLNFPNEKIKIKSYRKFRNKGLAVDCENEEEIQKLIDKIQKSDELKEKIAHKEPKKRRPRCIIYNIQKDTAEQEINLARSKVATASLVQFTQMTTPKFFLVQEPYIRNGRIEGLPRQWTSWLSGNGKAAANLEEKIKELDEALSKLQDENVIIGADMNAHCVRWGYRTNNNRGYQVENFMAEKNLQLLNSPGAEPTFQCHNEEGWSDLTPASNTTPANICDWEVMENESFSDHNFIYKIRNTYPLLSQIENKFGFSEGKSINHALRKLLDVIEDAKKLEHYVIVISLDVQGAFDNLKYDIIRKELRKLFTKSSISETLEDILSNRKVAIQTSDGPAVWKRPQGCPQGSCKSPLFWNIVAVEMLKTDWPEEIQLQAFADDFAFVISGRTRRELVQHTSFTLETFKNQTDKNQFDISIEKAQYLLIDKCPGVQSSDGTPNQ